MQVYYAFGPRAIPSAKPSTTAASAGRRAGAAPRLDFLSVAMCLVGVCSAAFHATLRQGAQFSDDLSMLLLAGGLLRRLYTYGQTPRVASLISAVVFLGTLVGTCNPPPPTILLFFVPFPSLQGLLCSRVST